MMRLPAAAYPATAMRNCYMFGDFDWPMRVVPEVQAQQKIQDHNTCPNLETMTFPLTAKYWVLSL